LSRSSSLFILVPILVPIIVNPLHFPLALANRKSPANPGIDELLAMVVTKNEEPRTTNTYYAIRDHQNTVWALVDGSGAVIESYDYDAWGRVLSVRDGDGTELARSAIGNRFLFHGREYSWSTGLYCFRARWYDPVTGRFLSNDPIGISGGLNQYVFCANNPINSTDPFGLDNFWGHHGQNFYVSGSTAAWPGAAGAVSSIQASTIAQGVNAALCDLGQPQPAGNVYPYQSDFAGVRNPGFTSGWPGSTSGHGPSWESAVVPGSDYIVKYYADPSRGQVIALTPPTSSTYHYWQAFRFYFLDQNVNQQHAVDFLVNRNFPFWDYNVFPNPYRDDNCK
jgi:RHS repeat-associated protein